MKDIYEILHGKQWEEVDENINFDIVCPDIELFTYTEIEQWYTINDKVYRITTYKDNTFKVEVKI